MQLNIITLHGVHAVAHISISYLALNQIRRRFLISVSLLLQGLT